MTPPPSPPDSSRDAQPKGHYSFVGGRLYQPNRRYSSALDPRLRWTGEHTPEGSSPLQGDLNTTDGEVGFGDDDLNLGYGIPRPQHVASASPELDQTMPQGNIYNLGAITSDVQHHQSEDADMMETDNTSAQEPNLDLAESEAPPQTRREEVETPEVQSQAQRRSVAKDIFGHLYFPPSSSSLPDGVSLTSICENYPNHIQGDVMDRFWENGWTAKDIQSRITARGNLERLNTARKDFLGQPWSVFQKRGCMRIQEIRDKTRNQERARRQARKNGQTPPPGGRKGKTQHRRRLDRDRESAQNRRVGPLIRAQLEESIRQAANAVTSNEPNESTAAGLPGSPLANSASAGHDQSSPRVGSPSPAENSSGHEPEQTASGFHGGEDHWDVTGIDESQGTHQQLPIDSDAGVATGMLHNEPYQFSNHNQQGQGFQYFATRQQGQAVPASVHQHGQGFQFIDFQHGQFLPVGEHEFISNHDVAEQFMAEQQLGTGARNLLGNEVFQQQVEQNPPLIDGNEMWNADQLMNYFNGVRDPAYPDALVHPGQDLLDPNTPGDGPVQEEIPTDGGQTNVSQPTETSAQDTAGTNEPGQDPSQPDPGEGFEAPFESYFEEAMEAFGYSLE